MTEPSSAVSALTLEANKQNQVLKACSFVFYMTMGIILPYFPIYFKSLGYSNLQLGVLYAVGPVTGIFAGLLWGMLSDKFQTIKKLFLVIFIGQLAVVSLMGLTAHFGLLLLIMLGFHFFQSAVIPLNDSMALLHIRRHGGSYASYRIWASIGFAASAFGFGFAIERWGIGSVLWLCAAAIVLSLGAAALLKERAGARSPFVIGDFWRLASGGRFLLFLLSVYLLSVGHRMNDAFIPLIVQGVGGSEQAVGLAMMTAALCEIPVFLLLMKWGGRFREETLLAAAAVVYMARHVLMSLSAHLAPVIALQSLQSLAFGTFLYAAVSLMGRMVPEKFRAMGQAVFAFVWAGLSGLSAGLLGGYLLDYSGHSLLYAVAAGFALLGLAGFLAIRTRASSSPIRGRQIGRF